VPAYFIIGGWGLRGRAYAAIKFFVYTFFGSAFLLVGNLGGRLLAPVPDRGAHLLAARPRAHPLQLDDRHLVVLGVHVGLRHQGAAVPVHTWSPDAYAEAPTGGSMILAGVLATARHVRHHPLRPQPVPQASRTLDRCCLTLAVIGILYGAVVACAQRDMKRLIAYSSLAQIGFIALASFAFTTQGLTGGVLLWSSRPDHRRAVLLVGWIYERRHTWQVNELRGLQRPAPVLAAILHRLDAGLDRPTGLNGFVSEFLILSGTFLPTVGGRCRHLGRHLRRPLPALGLPAGLPRQAQAGRREDAGPLLAERGIIAPLIILIVVLASTRSPSSTASPLR